MRKNMFPFRELGDHGRITRSTPNTGTLGLPVQAPPFQGKTPAKMSVKDQHTHEFVSDVVTV